jgi:predicted exporter
MIKIKIFHALLLSVVITGVGYNFSMFSRAEYCVNPLATWLSVCLVIERPVVQNPHEDFFRLTIFKY